jgi:hypothetical protein
LAGDVSPGKSGRHWLRSLCVFTVRPVRISHENTEEITVKLQRQAICVSIGLFIAAHMSMAQSANVYFGYGTAMDSSSNQQIDTFGTGVPYTTPKLGGSFLDVGSTVLFTDHFGVGADVSWRATHAAYAGLRMMPVFYDLDGVWQPGHTKRFEPEIHAGLGGMKLGYSFSQTNCNQLSGCETATESVTSSSHFQVHFSAAARFYLTDHVFIRPAVDGHYVANLFQYGRDVVPEYSLGIGYSFGRE